MVINHIRGKHFAPETHFTDADLFSASACVILCQTADSVRAKVVRRFDSAIIALRVLEFIAVRADVISGRGLRVNSWDDESVKAESLRLKINKNYLVIDRHDAQ